MHFVKAEVILGEVQTERYYCLATEEPSGACGLTYMDITLQGQSTCFVSSVYPTSFIVQNLSQLRSQQYLSLIDIPSTPA
jgi:hypothetical protein